MKYHISLLACLMWPCLTVYADAVEQSFLLDKEHIEKLAPEPGTIINQQNLQEYSDILPLNVVDLLQDEMFNMTVDESFSIAPHDAYLQATIEHHAETRLADEPGKLQTYIAGRPFPLEPEVEDIRAGEKLAWNIRYAYSPDSAHITDFFWHFKDIRKNKLERTLSFYASSMRFKHRHVQDPKPELENNPSDIFNALYMRALGPPDIRNSQYLVQRLEDDSKDEQAWLYLSAQRRVYRMPTGQNTDAFFGSDIMIEDFLGYNGRIIDQNWAYKGTAWVLLPFFHHNKMPLESVNEQDDGFEFIGFHGKGGCFPNVSWQLRKAYQLEAVPKDPDHPLSKRHFYIDAQTMAPAYVSIYDRAGKLWRIAIAGFSHPDSHHVDNRGSGMPIIDAVSMIDIQSMHCTALQFKTLLAKEPFNMLDFTPQALRAKGR